MPTRRVEIGPTGETVRATVAAVRKSRGLTLRDLSEKMSETGHPMAHNTISEIERGARRVDVDDLVALALALDIAPATLLMPGMPGAADRHAKVSVTGVKKRVSAEKLWLWLTADNPLTEMSVLTFMVNAQPEWRHTRWIESKG